MRVQDIDARLLAMALALDAAGLPVDDAHQGVARFVEQHIGDGKDAQFAQPFDIVQHERLERRVNLDDHVRDRKSTRLNSSHVRISYAVFCLKKKKKEIK